MTNIKRTVYRMSLFALIIWAMSRAVGLYQIYFPNRNHSMIPALQDMQTYCVGNYLIDLPQGSVPIRLETRMKGSRRTTFFVKPEITKANFEKRVTEHWNAIKDLKNDGPLVFEHPSQRFDVMPNGVVMTSQYHTTDLKDWPDGSSGPKSFYETDGYLWQDDTLYEFHSGTGKESLINAMKALQVRRDDEVPVGKGFCGGRSFFPGQSEPNDYVWFAFRLPVEPNTEFRIELPTGRSPRPNMALFESSEFKTKKLREANRKLAGFDGHEWIEYYWEKGWGETYDTSITAAWFGPGKEELEYPGVQIKLDIDVKVEGVAPPKMGEIIAVEGKQHLSADEFITLWDGIVKTFRERPGAF